MLESGKPPGEQHDSETAEDDAQKAGSDLKEGNDLVLQNLAGKSATEAQPDANKMHAPSWKQQLSRGGAAP